MGGCWFGYELEIDGEFRVRNNFFALDEEKARNFLRTDVAYFRTNRFVGRKVELKTFLLLGGFFGNKKLSLDLDTILEMRKN